MYPSNCLAIVSYPVKITVTCTEMLQTAIIINGIHTDIHCSVFTDYIYLIVTQFGKIGTLVCLHF